VDEIERGHWIFDLDGTLTRAVHDFDEMRRMLGLAPTVGILEALATMSLEQAAPLVERLDAYEYDLACTASAAEGAHELLTRLRRRGARLGIFTRNNTRNVEATLAAAGLGGFFDPAYLVTRDHGTPKPEPAGIFRLLGLWRAEPSQAVMVGNHASDVEAGRAAGTFTIYVDPAGTFDGYRDADLAVRSLVEIHARVRPAQEVP